MVIPVFSFASVFGLRAVAEDGLSGCSADLVNSWADRINSIMWEEISQDKPRQTEIGQAEQPLRLCHGHPLHSQFPMIHSSTFSYLFLISHYHQFIMSSIFSMNNLLTDYLSFASLTVCAFWSLNQARPLLAVDGQIMHANVTRFGYRSRENKIRSMVKF